MNMNKTSLLKEIGITSWVLRDVGLSSLDSSLVEQKVDRLKNMKWTLCTTQIFKSQELFKKILKTILDMGVECEVIYFDHLQKEQIEVAGELVIGFGQAAGQFLSKEKSNIEDMREIVFEVGNQLGNDVPVVITFHPDEVLAQYELKKLLWQDLLWARSIALEL